MDPNDFPLTRGAAYFANEDDYRKYVDRMGDVPPEVRDSRVRDQCD